MKKILFTLLAMAIVTTSAFAGGYPGYNNTQHPSIYFGGNEYRPFTQGFMDDLMNGNDEAYNNAYNNKYEWEPQANASSYYNPMGLPRVVWTNPSQY